MLSLCAVSIYICLSTSILKRHVPRANRYAINYIYIYIHGEYCQVVCGFRFTIRPIFCHCILCSVAIHNQNVIMLSFRNMLIS